MKLILNRKNTILKADGKILDFKDGVCEVKKITKSIQNLVDKGYIKIEEKEDGKPTNS